MAERMLLPSSARGPPRIHCMARRGPATLVARIRRSRGWRLSQLPTMASVRVQVSAHGGTGYVSAVSIKFTPCATA